MNLPLGSMGELEGESAEGLGLHPLLFKAKKGAVTSQLAELEFGLKEQQIRRYEVSEYASASLARVRSVGEV